MAGWKNYAVFSGRSRRLEYWTFNLVNIAIYFLLGLSASLTDGAVRNVLLILFVVFALAMLLPGLAITVRRLHDTGRSGAWYFICFVPFIGGLWLLGLTLMDSEHGDNAYGPDPKRAIA